MDKKIIDKWINILNLSNWNIQVIEEYCLENEGLSNCIFNDYLAIVKIKKTLSETEKEKTLIHELLHIVHRDESDLIVDSLNNEIARTMYIRFHERSIEQMAQSLYKLCYNKINGGD